MRVVHIGFPKTATTFLQERVFPRLADRFVYFDRGESAAYFEELVGYDDSVFDADGVRDRFGRAFERGPKTLFSYEPLTGAHYQSAFVNRSQIARRLRRVGFDRAIISVRNQFDALESSYKQYVKSGGILKLDEYITFDSSKRRYLYPEYFEYFSMYRLYAGIFGAENVLILQYEDLAGGSFLRQLCSFLQEATLEVARSEAVNPSLSCDKVRILRILNHFTCSSYQPSHLISRRVSTEFCYRQLQRLPALNSRKSLLEPTTRLAIADFYSESNKSLERSAGITLARDYP
jgi:hypothetical protein